jgi:hypothetical protein
MLRGMLHIASNTDYTNPLKIWYTKPLKLFSPQSPSLFGVFNTLLQYLNNSRD